MNPQENTPNVKDYYDRSHRWYRWAYYDSDSLAVHYGFWDKPGVSRKEALTNQYRLASGLLDLKDGERVLDAGCGVCGASLWMAARVNAHFTGITISESQLKDAKENIERRGLSERVTAQLGDYFKTGFADGSFDKAFAIESFCYAYPEPLALYREMFRILRPGGRLVISDGVLLKKPNSDRERWLSNEFCQGFKMAGWCTPEEVTENLEAAGFTALRYLDKTKEIEPSTRDIERRAKLVAPFRFLKVFGLVSQTEVDNLRVTLTQRELYERGLFGYGVFVADKP